MSFFVRRWPAPAASLRPRRPLRLFVLPLWLGAMAALLPQSAPAADFTPDQRKAIESMIREYLTKNTPSYSRADDIHREAENLDN